MLLDILGGPLTSNKLSILTGKAFRAAEEAIRVSFLHQLLVSLILKLKTIIKVSSDLMVLVQEIVFQRI